MGLFHNKFVQVVGNADSGKTKFILDYIRRYQDKYRSDTTFYLDVDHDLVLGYLQKNDIDLYRFFYGNNIDVLLKILASEPHNINLVIVDSLPMIGREQNVEVFMQNLRHAIDMNNGLTVMLINQYRHDIIANGLLVPWYQNVINKYIDISLTIESGAIQNESVNSHRKTAILSKFSSMDNTLLSIAQNINKRALFVCK